MKAGMRENVIVATVAEDFGAGPFSLSTDHDLAELGDDDRIIVAFADFEALFTVIGRARGAVHFGLFLSPWFYTHWRAERRQDRWSLTTTDRVAIAKLAKLYEAKTPRS